MPKNNQSRQIPLDLSLPISYDAGDYIIGAQNQQIIAIMQQFPHWNSAWIWIEGDEGSGKTHLAHMFQSVMELSEIITINKPLEVLQQELEHKPYLVFDDTIPQDAQGQEILFHMINMVKNNQGHGVILSPFLEQDSNVLPDLRSRLDQMMRFRLRPPDDDMVRALLMKLFADRQLQLRLPQLNWLVPRMRRSYPFLRDFVQNVDAMSLSTHKGITQPLLKAVLEQMLAEES